MRNRQKWTHRCVGSALPSSSTEFDGSTDCVDMLHCRRPLNVLIVEDDPSRESVLRSIFRSHAVVSVRTAEKAITFVRSIVFDLVFLDYDLAGELKGDAAAEVLAARQENGTQTIAHSMNAPGRDAIRRHLPDMIILPFSRLASTNERVRAIRDEVDRDPVRAVEMLQQYGIR